MSHDVNVNIPMDVQTNEKETKKLLSFHYIYDECVANPKLFKELKESEDLANFLSKPDRLNGYLPARCHKGLKALLKNNDSVAAIEECIKNGVPWEESLKLVPPTRLMENKILRVRCHWGECP